MDNSTQTILLNFISSLVRHVLTGASVWLAAHQFLDPAQTTNFVEIGVTAALAIAGLGWSYMQKVYAQKKLQAAAQTGTASPAKSIINQQKL